MAHDESIVRKRLLDLMASREFIPMRKRRLARRLGIEEEDYGEFRRLVETMEEEGAVAELKHGKFGLPPAGGLAPIQAGGPRVKAKRRDRGRERAEEVLPAAEGAGQPPKLPKHARVGRIEIKRAGFGFFISDPPGNDLYVAQEDLGGALSGDLVAVVPKGGVHGGRRQHRRFAQAGTRTTARVLRVVERAHAVIVGTYYSHKPSRYDSPDGPAGFIVPDTRGLFGELDVLPPDKSTAHDGDKVAVELIEAWEKNRPGARPSARVVEVYGEAGEARAEIAAVIRNFGLRVEFPEAVLAQAGAIPGAIPADELARRADYSTPLTFTIDPADAKDHDDAVALRDLDSGRTELLVHIADVAHYVPEDSPLDLEARTRGTSVYLPGQVLPMLPPRLSNDLCSLKENQQRLTLTCAMVFGRDQRMEAFRIERSYIRSAAFLNYDQVRDALDASDPARLPSREIYEVLRRMKAFAGGLRRKRMESGAIDLDLPEVKLLLDEQGAVTGLVKVEQHWAHQLIEDMMLAANRTVATWLVEHEVSGLFRVHEEPDPDALARFAEFIAAFGLTLRPPYDRVKLRHVLERVRNKEYQHAIHLALLTSLKQARYSAECHPHYALNFTRYLHFTSPIRRYPDLVVHRALHGCFEPGARALPERGPKHGGRGGLGRQREFMPLATHCSHRERQAASAEDEVRKFRQIQYLRANQRESHPGVITHVRDFGFFVEMQDSYVEGLVRVQDLADDYYEYFEKQHLLQGRRKGRAFRLGDKVTVRVLHIDVGQRKVGLAVV